MRKTTAVYLAAAGFGAWWAFRMLRTMRGYDLRGKTVLITGGSRGLGLVLARELARHGTQLVICARDESELRRAYDELTARGASVLAVPCDVTDKGQVNEMVKSAEDYFGAIHVLINNAGVIQVGPIEVMTLADYEESMRTHFWAPLNVILAVLPQMRRRREGRIVNISSIGGKLSVPHLVPYDASKFALTGLSEGLRAELRKDGIYVTTVCPGLMRTGSPVNAQFKGRHRAEYSWFSISDSLPLLTMSAERAARQIIGALKRGDAEIILTLPAKVASIFQGLFPGLTAEVLALVNQMLPAPGGVGTQSVKGKDSGSVLSPSLLTLLSDRAAFRNNEMN